MVARVRRTEADRKVAATPLADSGRRTTDAIRAGPSAAATQGALPAITGGEAASRNGFNRVSRVAAARAVARRIRGRVRGSRRRAALSGYTASTRSRPRLPIRLAGCVGFW